MPRTYIFQIIIYITHISPIQITRLKVTYSSNFVFSNSIFCPYITHFSTKTDKSSQKTSLKHPRIQNTPPHSYSRISYIPLYYLTTPHNCKISLTLSVRNRLIFAAHSGNINRINVATDKIASAPLIRHCFLFSLNSLDS